MRLVCYSSPQGTRVAALRGSELVDLQQADAGLPSCVKQFLCLGAEGWSRAAAAVERAAGTPLDAATLVPPIPSPDKIICIGLNYADHAREGGKDIPREPVVFNKFPTALRKHGDRVVLPRVSENVDYEAELVVVIGRGGRYIPRSEAMAHVAAYCCGNDISARDWQTGKDGGQWLLGKSFDSFAPIGPWLVTADELGDPHHLRIQLRLNGQVMQDSSTSQLIFPVDELVSYVSQVCTLAPGDLIFTGTPPGVGFARRPPVWLKAGDVLEVEIERIGTLRSEVTSEAELG